MASRLPAEGAPTAGAGFVTCPNGREPLSDGAACGRGPPIRGERLPGLPVGDRLGTWRACRLRER